MIDETADEAAERMERRWTPGPWEVGASRNGYARINGARYKPQQHMGMAKVVIEIDDGPYPRGEANARLIAAAPELYEALDVIVRFNDGDPAIASKYHKTIYDAARTALKKARGE